jgi:biotin synthase
MVAGGREITFKERQYEIFNLGVNSIVIGNYLTTNGSEAKNELDILKKQGFNIVQTCK